MQVFADAKLTHNYPRWVSVEGLSREHIPVDLYYGAGEETISAFLPSPYVAVKVNISGVKVGARFGLMKVGIDLGLSENAEKT
jgi:hypothetical protein